MVFRSKVDTWLVAVVGAADAMPLLFAFAMRDSLPLHVLVVVLAVCSMATSLTFVVLFGIRYELGAEALVARVGPLRWTVPYAAMTDVRATRDPASAPAASLDRLRVEWTGDAPSGRTRALLVSPAERESFLEALRERAPQLRASGA